MLIYLAVVDLHWPVLLKEMSSTHFLCCLSQHRKFCFLCIQGRRGDGRGGENRRGSRGGGQGWGWGEREDRKGKGEGEGEGREEERRRVGEGEGEG